MFFQYMYFTKFGWTETLDQMLSGVFLKYQLISRSWHTDLDYGSYNLTNLEIGLTANMTGRQGMLNTPRYLITPLIFPGVHVGLILIA
jgi:hypothetical protein